jgi:hypothetical protein
MGHRDSRNWAYAQLRDIEAGMESFKYVSTKFRSLVRRKVSLRTPYFNRPHTALQPVALFAFASPVFLFMAHRVFTRDA